MPIKTQSDLPAKEILEKENIFVMDENRATHQDIRAINIAILNLMPLKEDTELQLLRSLSNTPLQVDVTFVAVSSHESKNTSMSHLNKFYETFADIKNRYFDGLILPERRWNRWNMKRWIIGRKCARSLSGARHMPPLPYISAGVRRQGSIIIMV